MSIISFLKEKYKQKDYRFFSLIIFSFFPIYSYGLITIVTILFLLSIIGTYIFNEDLRGEEKKNKITYFLIFTSPFIFLIFSCFYSEENITKQILKNIWFILVPFFLIFFPLKNLKKIDVKFILSCFTMACIVLSFYFFWQLYYNYSDEYKSILQFVRQTFFENLSRHPTYVSLFYAVSIIFLWTNYGKGIHYGYKIFVTFLLGVFILLLVSRAVQIGLICVWIIFIILKIKKKSHKLLSLLLLLGIIGFLYKQIPGIENRFSSFLQVELVNPDPNHLSSTNLRIGTLKCIKPILLNNWFLGVGVGDIQNRLDECYLNKYTTNLYQRRTFNTHNNYLHFICSAGIFCLISFLYLCFFMIKTSYINKNWFLLAFFILVCIVLFFENLLSRSYGITLFLFLWSIFFYNTQINLKNEYNILTRILKKIE